MSRKGYILTISLTRVCFVVVIMVVIGATSTIWEDSGCCLPSGCNENITGKWRHKGKSVTVVLY